MVQHGSANEAARLKALHQIDPLNTELTGYETSFSAHIAEAARAATRLVTIVLWSVSLILWSVAIGLAWRTYRKGAEATIRPDGERSPLPGLCRDCLGLVLGDRS